MRNRFIFIFTLIVLLIAGCNDEVETFEDPIKHKDISSPEAEVDISFSQALQSISFTGHLSLGYRGRELSEIPESLIIHSENFSIHFELRNSNKDEINQLLNQIIVQGTSDFTIEMDPDKSSYFHLSLRALEEPVIINLGDIPPIKVKRLQPLQVDIVRQGFEHSNFISEVPSYQQISVRVSEHEQKLILNFSESMDTSAEPNSLPLGKWLDDQTYEVDIKRTELNTDESRFIPLNKFFSKSGNYLFQSHDVPGVLLAWVKEINWLDIETHERVGWSERDFLYDSIVYSPDGSQYIGTVKMLYDNGHNHDYIHSLILEQRGKPPFIIEESHGQVQWLDNQRLLYTIGKNVYVYDFEKNERELVHDWSGKEGNLQQIVYDRKENRLLAVFVRPDKEAVDAYKFLYDKLIFQDLDQPILNEENYTNAEMEIWPNVPQMLVHVTSKGYYWTTTKDGQIITKFEGRNGEVDEFVGEVVYANDDFVIFIDESYSESESNLNQTMYILDNRNSLSKAAEPPGYIRMVGSKPIAIEDKDYYQYDVQKDSWEIWNKKSSISFSSHDQVGLYKKLD